MKDKRFTRQKYTDGEYSIQFTRSFYGTYHIVLSLSGNGLVLGTLEEDTNFSKINAVWEFLRRQSNNVWVSVIGE